MSAPRPRNTPDPSLSFYTSDPSWNQYPIVTPDVSPMGTIHSLSNNLSYRALHPGPGGQPLASKVMASPPVHAITWRNIKLVLMLVIVILAVCVFGGAMRARGRKR